MSRTRYGVKGVRIGDSPFGLGLFATRRFRPEETVGQVVGETIDDPDHGSDYCMDLFNGLSLEPGAPFRYLNHSCQPNCTLVHCEVEDEDGRACQPEMWVEALSAIRPGEQLTIDYAWPAELAIPCGCGSPNCRGWIVAQEQLHQLLARQKKRKTEKVKAR